MDNYRELKIRYDPGFGHLPYESLLPPSYLISG